MRVEKIGKLLAPIGTGTLSSLLAYALVEGTQKKILLAAGTCSVSLLTWWFVARRRKGKRVFIVISEANGKQFFGELVGRMHDELAARGFEVVLKKPSMDFSASDQDKMFKDILRHRADYVGGVVVPVQPGERRQTILDFAVDFGKPLIFLDVEPVEKETDYPPNTCFVGTDNEVGGDLAAKAMVRNLSDKYPDRLTAVPRILVIASQIQTVRQESFARNFSAVFPLAEITIKDTGGFSREKARLVAADSLLDGFKRDRSYDGVVCTNDEMALGVAKFLYRLKGIPKPSSVVGYDGIEESLEVVDRGCLALTNTVVQDVHGIAKEAVGNLDGLLKDGAPVKRVSRVSPHLHKPIGARADHAA